MTMLVRGGATGAAGSALPATATTGQVLQWNGSAWVAATPSASGTTPNATPTVPGLVQLAGDLGGTATAPTVAKINGATPAAVATSGAYADLTGRPALAGVATSGSYTDLTGRPALAGVATSGSYGDLTGRPLLAPVATSGSYADLTGRPAATGAWGPADYGWIGWTGDAVAATSPLGVNSNGYVYTVRVRLTAAATVTNVLVNVTAAGAGLGQAFAGLYTAAGALLAGTASQATAWTSTGLKVAALTTPQTVAAGDYFVAFLVNGATTAPTFSGLGTSPLLNAGLTATAYRSATSTGSGNAALPASLPAMGANTSLFWAALS